MLRDFPVTVLTGGDEETVIRSFWLFHRQDMGRREISDVDPNIYTRRCAAILLCTAHQISDALVRCVECREIFEVMENRADDQGRIDLKESEYIQY